MADLLHPGRSAVNIFQKKTPGAAKSHRRALLDHWLSGKPTRPGQPGHSPGNGSPAVAHAELSATAHDDTHIPVRLSLAKPAWLCHTRARPPDTGQGQSDPSCLFPRLSPG